MKKNLSIIVSLFLMFLLIGNVLNAQTSKVSIVINNPETFIQISDNEIVINFDLIILDGFIDSKWIKTKAEENSNVIKFGVSNYADFKSGERKAYLKVKKEPIQTFAEVILSLDCNEVKYNGKIVSITDFVNTLENKK